MRLFSHPRTVKDIYNTDIYQSKNIWTVLDIHKRVSGQLSFDDEGTSLAFEVPRAQIGDFKDGPFETVTCIGDSYSRMYLVNSRVHEHYSSQIFSHPRAKMRLTPAYAVLQSQGTKLRELKITQLSGYLPGIAQWFEEDMLDFDYDKDQFKNAKPIYHDISLGHAGKLTLRCRVLFNDNHVELGKRFEARAESYVVINFSRPATVDSAVNVFSHVENFFNFIFSEPHTTHIFKASHPHIKRENSLEILTSQRGRTYRREDSTYGGQMLFKFRDITNINDIFTNWVINYSTIREFADALILLKSTKISEQMRFTTLVNALESLHRKYYDRRIMSDADYRKKVDSIIAKLDPNEFELVKPRLDFGNELALRTRLNEIYALCEKHGLTRPDKKHRDKIISSRNYFTHGGVKTEKVFTESELYYVNSRLAQYLKLVLLKVTKIVDLDLTGIVKTSPHFSPHYRDEPATNSRLLL